MDWSKLNPLNWPKRDQYLAAGTTAVAGVGGLFAYKLASKSGPVASPAAKPAATSTVKTPPLMPVLPSELPPSIPIVKPEVVVPPPPVPPVIPTGPSAIPLSTTNQGPKAVVTTSDPAPAGDLAIRSQPDLSAPVIGGAEKQGIVNVIRQVNSDWSEVYWPGGSRWPEVQGFARHRYLSAVSNEIIPPEKVVGASAIVTTNDPAPAGDLLIRSQPNSTASAVGTAEKGGTVTIIRDVDATWAEVLWPGGTRYPKAQGFTRKAYLKLV